MQKSASRVATIVAAALGAALLLPTAASAVRNPGSELLGSFCSFDQIDRAAHVIAPFEATFYVDQNPVAKTALRGWFMVPQPERVLRRNQLEGRYPGVFEPRNWLTDSPRSRQHQLQLEAIVDSCHKF